MRILLSTLVSSDLYSSISLSWNTPMSRRQRSASRAGHFPPIWLTLHSVRHHKHDLPVAEQKHAVPAVLYNVQIPLPMVYMVYTKVYITVFITISLLQLLPAGADGSVEARTANTVAPIFFLGHPIGSAHAQL
jgi:hypothetical protein